MTTERRKLVSAARRVLLTRTDAEDAVQDTYLRALTAFPGRTTPPAWLHAVLRNVAIDRLRRRRLESGHAADVLPSHDSLETLLAITSDCEAALERLLKRVSATEGAALLLRDVFEFDHDEIGRLLGKSETTTRQFLHRARARLRRDEREAPAAAVDVGLFWRCIESRDPARLIEMLKTATTRAQCVGTSVAPRESAQSSSMLVQVNGHYALAIVLDGIVLCVVPVGTQASLIDESA